MERFDEHDRLAVALVDLRPTPEDEFAAELDALVAAGFPRRSRLLPTALGERLRIPSPRRLAYAGGTVAVVAIAVAAALIGSADSGSPARMAIDGDGRGKPGGVQFSEALPNLPHAKSLGNASAASEELSDFNASLPTSRDIERSAQVALLADPEDVADDSARVFAAVHDAHGIVLRSNTTQEPAGRAGATFDLLVPSARLGDALAAISAIDEVGSRHDATADITAPTVATGKRLHETRASIARLLSQLASAATEPERETLEAELRSERRQAVALEAQLAHLHRRTRYSHLSVRIETGSAASSGGAWGFDDALGNAGHILGLAAGVTLVALAVLAPLAILALLAWLAHRAWLRIRRERALSGG